MNGEKKQWLLLDDNVFSVTEPLTTDEIKELRGSEWYRPLVTYIHDDAEPGGGEHCTVEIHDTVHWPESLRKIEEMRRRDGEILED